MNTFSALADPIRLDIVETLAVRSRSVNELVGMFDVSQPAISRHLRILREAGLVSVMPVGQSRVYRLDPAPLREIDAWLERYRDFWSSRLDALEHHLEKDS
jgi:DNA-binding transcriptional ArsR family regulator